MLQQGLQYSKVTTGRVCAFRKSGGRSYEGSDGEKEETQRAVIGAPMSI